VMWCGEAAGDDVGVIVNECVVEVQSLTKIVREMLLLSRKELDDGRRRSKIDVAVMTRLFT